MGNSFVGAGNDNSAREIYSCVVAGFRNTAEGIDSFVGAGGKNLASGRASAILGGSSNKASGDYSIAMGSNAIASNDRSLVINLTEEGPPSKSTDDGQFLVKSDVFTIQIGSEKATINQDNISKLQALLVPVTSPVTPSPVPSNTA